ncbi:MAG: FAD-dependent oxidoreductase [Eubacterium sp.]|nr:FAD-dependent oxidoreductase [Eubacterium sp.]
MQNKYFPKLFEKGKIGNLTLKNRTIRNSMGTYLCNPDCSVTPNNIKAAAEAAEGGVGLVFMDNAVVQDMRHMGLNASSDPHISGLSLVADAIKEHGAAAGLQLSHPGRDGGFVGGDDVVAASRITVEEWFEMGAQVPRELTIEEIHEIVECYGDAALRAKKAGFDIVEVMAAAGCLPCNFLSPKDNQRRDMYGGTLKNRMRFIIEIVRNIKKKTGCDYPLSFKLSVDDYEENSIRTEETIEVAKALEKEGVDLLNLVCGTHATTWTQTGFYPLGIYVPYAEAVKKEVHIPVLVTGNIQSPEQAEQILEEGRADFIGLARSQLADPYFVKKAKEGRSEDIVPCIRCMIGCNDKGLLADTVIHCAVNPTLYKFECPKIVPAETPKNVAVIGGGPGGLEAAVTLKKRGHNVTLYEKRALGGMIIEASVPEYKADIRKLTAYYETQVKKLNIPVIMEEATAETIRKGNYDAAIVAIGGKTKTLDVPGIDKKHVSYTVDSVLAQKMPEGKSAVVIGGGITGAETALELAEAGKEVTIVEMMDQFLGKFSAVVPAYMQAIAKAGIQIITGKRLESVTDHAAVIVDRFGSRQELEADAVVICAGFAPQPQLAEELEEFLEDVISVGDCKQVRQIYDAVHEGYIAARCL